MNNVQSTIHTTRLGQDLETYFIPASQADLFLPISTIFQLISTLRAGNQLSFNTDRIRSAMRDESFVKKLVGKSFLDSRIRCCGGSTFDSAFKFILILQTSSRR